MQLLNSCLLLTPFPVHLVHSTRQINLIYSFKNTYLSSYLLQIPRLTRRLQRYNTEAPLPSIRRHTCTEHFPGLFINNGHLPQMLSCSCSPRECSGTRCLSATPSTAAVWTSERTWSVSCGCSAQCSLARQSAVLAAIAEVGCEGGSTADRSVRLLPQRQVRCAHVVAGPADAEGAA